MQEAEPETSASGSVQIDELRAIRTRELNLKRVHGAIACAECRRLKLKCDKKVPCLNCKRRGCESICPTGVGARVRESRRSRTPRNVQPSSKEPSSKARATSKETRSSGLNWLNSLRSKLVAMSDRIRTLEDALQEEYSLHQTLRRLLDSQLPSDNIDSIYAPFESNRQNLRKGKSKEVEVPSDSSISESTHPLLTPGLLQIKDGIEVYTPYPDLRSDASTIVNAEEDSTSQMIGAFGMLTVDDSQHVGLSGASGPEDDLLLAISNKEKETSPGPSSENEQDPTNLSAAVIQANALWPFPPLNLPSPTLVSDLVLRLPSRDQALALTECFFARFTWICIPLEREQAFNELIPLFYSSAIYDTTSPGPETSAKKHPQELALLFAVFGCGASMASPLASDDPEANYYADLARAAFSLRSFLEDGSVTACQTLLLLDALATKIHKGPSENALWLTDIAKALANNAGLNRDPERLGLPREAVQKRRHVFWQIYAADLWRCLTSGRPPAFTLNAIDVRFPEFPRGFVGDDGRDVMSVQEWRYRFARDVLSHAAEKVTSAHPIKYSEILELDQKSRAFGPHPFGIQMPQRYTSWKPSYFSLHPGGTVWYLESLLLFIHRNFFARAMVDFPEDPLRSVFAPSVVASYRSASCILRLYRGSYGSYHAQASMLDRVWYVWATCISCSVILAIVAAKGRALEFSMAAFQELELSMELYAKQNNPVVKHGLVFLKRLRDKAYGVLFNDANKDPAAQRRAIPLQSSSQPATTGKSATETSSSLIVSSQLFQDTIMAKFIRRDIPKNSGSEHKESNADPSHPSDSTVPTWTNVSVAPTAPSLINFQAASQLPSSHAVVTDNQEPLPNSPGDASFLTSAFDWRAMSQPGLETSGENVDASGSAPCSTFDLSSSSNILIDAAPAFDYSSSANMDIDMDTVFNGGTDWLNFMQLAEAFALESSASAGVDFGNSESDGGLDSHGFSNS